MLEECQAWFVVGCRWGCVPLTWAQVAPWAVSMLSVLGRIWWPFPPCQAWLPHPGWPSRGASFLPGCQNPWSTTSPGCPCPWPSIPQQPCLPQSCPSRAVGTGWHGCGPPELGPSWWRSCYHFPALMPGGSNWSWGCFLLSHSTFSARSPVSDPFIYSESMSDFLLSNFCLILPLSRQEEVVFLLHYSPPPHSLNENSLTGFPPLAKQREV